ncbi:E3 SUMO-protein ligase ZBED1-like [Anomaloglossus baeobatrachus]|uniref:E3 SUMO-protein ligase ZBED1-like n=1 Tax=Anomaloglossus baeobatrachus TaxID=238106 RepID=UPI003F4FCA20
MPRARDRFKSPAARGESGHIHKAAGDERPERDTAQQISKSLHRGEGLHQEHSSGSIKPSVRSRTCKMASGLNTTIRRKREKVSSLEMTSSSLSVDHCKSKLWSYYTKLGDAYVECKVCKKQLSFHNSTTTMREHLVRSHSLRSVGNPQTKEQPELDYHEQEGSGKRLRQAAPMNSICLSVSDSRPQMIADLILEMIYRDLHPLSVVEDKGLGLLLGYLEPNFDLPTSTQLADMLWHKYTDVKRQLKCCLQSAHSVVLSIETWDDHPKKSCIAITANVIDSDWRLCRYLLETQHVLKNKTDHNLPEQLCAVLTDFGLSANLVTCVVHDRSSSLTAHAQSFRDSYGWSSFCCTAHVLQLCVQAGLDVQEVKEALAAARGLVSYFQEDYKASCYLSAKLEAMNKPRLVMDTERYWISTLEMCQSLLDLKWAILSILEEQGAKNLSEQHWKLLQDLVAMLKTIWIATAFLQEEPNTSISSVLPCVHGIFTAVGQTSEGSVLKAAAYQICSEICRHWDMLDEGKLITNPLAIASFLDPRFKELRFLKPCARGELHNMVRNKLSQMCEPGAMRHAWMSSSCAIEGGTEMLQLAVRKDKEPGVGTENFYDLLLGRDPTESMPEAHQQLENYMVEPVCKRTTDPLVWWNSNHHRFPTLARLARQYLTMPATAIKPERAFRTVPDPMEKRFDSLESKYLDQILFLHQNKELVDWSMKPSV